MTLSALTRVNDAVAELCAAGRGHVCFDADGVLWREDVANDYMVSCLDRHILRPMQEDIARKAWEALWRGELDIEGETRLAAISVEVLQGLREDFVAADCAAFAQKRFAPLLIPETRDWVTRLQTAGVTCWVLSGSLIWGVRAGAALVGIPPERVLAVGTLACNGILTPKLAQPFTYGPGKAEAIRKILPEPPLMAFGNTINDVPMLETATRLAVAIEPDGGLARIAAERDWPVLELRR